MGAQGWMEIEVDGVKTWGVPPEDGGDEARLVCASCGEAFSSHSQAELNGCRKALVQEIGEAAGRLLAQGAADGIRSEVR